jgi:deazaflavin-dependent oxidoreductase (nitroreductase family)
VTPTPRPPSSARLAFYRFMNPVIMFMVRRFGSGGRGVDLLRILRVAGRKTGRAYELPVRVASFDDGRYVISMLGNSQWARNLRAAGEGQLILGSSVETVTARELQGQEKTAFLARCCAHSVFERRARSVLKMAFGRSAKSLGATDIDLLAQVWCVFRVEALR